MLSTKSRSVRRIASGSKSPLSTPGPKSAISAEAASCGGVGVDGAEEVSTPNAIMPPLKARPSATAATFAIVGESCSRRSDAPTSGARASV